MNAFAERWVLSARVECLDHFVVFGEAHLRHLLTEYTSFYNEDRPHQGVGNLPLATAWSLPMAEPVSTAGSVECRERLGGLLKHYGQRAS